MSVAAIDPGLRRTGLAVVHHGQVLAAATLRCPRGTGIDFAGVAEAGIQIARQAWAWLEDQGVLGVAAESFIDQGGRRRYRDRWRVPVVCGAIAALAPPGYRIAWQDPIVLSAEQYGTLYGVWRIGRRGMIGGDRLLADEHQASAGCHALHREAILRTPLAAGRDS